MREETRIKATSDEASGWAQDVEAVGGMASPSESLTESSHLRPGPASNFISDIFYLTSAVNHYGLNRTVQTFEELYKQVDELQRHVDLLTSSMAPLRPGVCLLLKLLLF